VDCFRAKLIFTFTYALLRRATGIDGAGGDDYDMMMMMKMMMKLLESVWFEF